MTSQSQPIVVSNDQPEAWGSGARGIFSASEDFTCAICCRVVDMRWNFGRGPGRRGATLPPLCAYCEGSYTQGVGKPSSGSFADRRTAMQIAALAEGLRTEAARKSWPRSWGRSDAAS